MVPSRVMSIRRNTRWRCRRSAWVKHRPDEEQRVGVQYTVLLLESLERLFVR